MRNKESWWRRPLVITTAMLPNAVLGVPYSAGIDARLFGADSVRMTRGGYAYGRTGDSREDHYLFISTRYGPWIGRGGMASTSAYGYSSWSPRLGLGVQYARWTVGFAREDAGAGLGPTYQFMLSSVIK